MLYVITSVWLISLTIYEQLQPDQVVFETFTNREGKEFICAYRNGKRYYLDSWHSQVHVFFSSIGNLWFNCSLSRHRKRIKSLNCYKFWNFEKHRKLSSNELNYMKWILIILCLTQPDSARDTGMLNNRVEHSVSRNHFNTCY